LPANNYIGIRANYIDMAKFSGEDDQGYQSVSTELMRWVRAIPKDPGPAVPAPASSPSQWASMSPGPNGYVYSPYYPPQLAQGPVNAMYSSQSPAGEWPQGSRGSPPSSETVHDGNVVLGTGNNYGNGSVVSGSTINGGMTFSYR
jgi:hypothetical protein